MIIAIQWETSLLTSPFAESFTERDVKLKAKVWILTRVQLNIR